MAGPVTIVVVLQGGADQALRCLSSIAALVEEPEHDVVVVDDASIGLDELLARLEGDVEIVRLPTRSGQAAAAVAGVERADGDDVVVLLGAPTVAPDFLAPLLGALGDGVSAATGAPGGVAAPLVRADAIAARRADLLAIDRTQLAVSDGLAAAALLQGLAPAGRAVSVPESTVVPATARSEGTRGMLGADPELTIVIPTLDVTSARVRACVSAAQATTGVPHEIVVVDNGSPPQGFTAPVNAGLRAARSPYMVVMNDDVELLPGWWAPLRAALDGGAAVAFPLTIDGEMREDFAAWCFAISRATLDEFSVAPGEFFDPAMRVWYQDTDLMFRLRRVGRPPVLVKESHIRHGLSETVATSDPQLRAWIDQRIDEDRAVFESRWAGGAPAA